MDSTERLPVQYKPYSNQAPLIGSCYNQWSWSVIPTILICTRSLRMAIPVQYISYIQDTLHSLGTR